MPTGQHLRTPAQLAGYYEGLDLVDPGQVQLPQWRPDPETDTSLVVSAYCAVGRKR